MDWPNFVNTFWDNTRDGLAVGSIYALVALGYTLVYGVLRLINFANSEVFMLGTFGSFAALWLLDVPTRRRADGGARPRRRPGPQLRAVGGVLGRGGGGRSSDWPTGRCAAGGHPGSCS